MRNLRIPAIVFILIFLLLTIVQLKVDNPMIILESFISGGGWIEILLITVLLIIIFAALILRFIGLRILHAEFIALARM